MKTFLIIDYWVQTLLLSLMFFTIPLVFLPMLLIAVFGGWQLFSGLITGLFFKKLNRKFYFIKAIGYLCILGFGQLLLETQLLSEVFNNSLVFVFFYFVGPIIIGTWYYRMIKNDYQKYCHPKPVENNKMMMNSPMVIN